MPYYKVVRVTEDGKRISSFAEGDWQREYSTEEDTTAPRGKLWIYEYPSDQAAQFAPERGVGRELWEVEAGNVERAQRYFVHQAFWEDYWGTQAVRSKLLLTHSPKCTHYERWAARVRLVRRVLTWRYLGTGGVLWHDEEE